MTGFILWRAAQTVPVLLFVSLLVFGLLAAAPGDQARRILATGGGEQLDERDLAAKRVELGLNDPLWERYGRWLRGALELDLGRSYVNKKPVVDLLAERLPASLKLAAVSLAASLVLSVPLGVLAGTRAGGAVDGTIRVFTLMGASLPAFWLALLAMWLFAVELGWFPALGDPSPRGMVLPAAVLTLRTVGLLTRLTRACVLDALGMDHIRTARAKGLLPRVVTWRHVLPNALIPIVTIAGLDFASLFAHATIVEWVFAWPGIGRLGVDAALANDVPVVLGYVLVTVVIVVATNLLVDISYSLVDPRLRGIAP